MDQLLAFRAVTFQRIKATFSEVVDDLRLIQRAAGGISEALIRAIKAFLRPIPFGDDIGMPNSLRDGRANQVGRLIVAMVGEPDFGRIGLVRLDQIVDDPVSFLKQVILRDGVSLFG